MITAKKFATLAIAGLAASTSTAAMAQNTGSVDAMAAEKAAGAAFMTATAMNNGVQAAPIAAAAAELPAIQTVAPIAVAAAPMAAKAAPVIAHAATSHAGGSYGYPAQQSHHQTQPHYTAARTIPAQQYAPAQAYQVQYTPEQWLEECYARTGGKRRGERGQGVGGILGAVAGGIAGNRIAGRGERLAGSLIGAGVGGLAGAVVGGLIGRSGKRGGYDCDAALERHMALVQNGQYQPVHHTAARTIPAPQYVPAPQYYAPVQVQSYAQPVMYVEQQVAVPQRAVVREYVTEEYVEAPQPVPTKRVKRVPIYVKDR